MSKRNKAVDILLCLLKCVGYVLFWFLISNLVAIIGEVFLLASHPGLDEREFLVLYYKSATALNVLANCIVIFIFGFFYSKKGIGLFERTSLKRVKPSLFINTIIFGCAFLFVINVVLSLLSLIIPQSWTEMHDEYSSILLSGNEIVQFLAVGLVAPICEEIVFRGLVANTLSKKMHYWIAIVISALAFGLVHGNPLQFIYATIMGIVLGWLFFKTKSLVPCVIFHMSFNIVSFLLSESNISLIVLILAPIVVVIEVFVISRICKKSEENDENNKED